MAKTDKEHGLHSLHEFIDGFAWYKGADTKIELHRPFKEQNIQYGRKLN